MVTSTALCKSKAEDQGKKSYNIIIGLVIAILYYGQSRKSGGDAARPRMHFSLLGERGSAAHLGSYNEQINKKP